jgi:UDPglucose 6-dehydrogenase
VLVTEWPQFRTPDFAALADALRGKVLFDGRNLYEPQAVRRAGLAYHGIGRSAPGAAS